MLVFQSRPPFLSVGGFFHRGHYLCIKDAFYPQCRDRLSGPVSRVFPGKRREASGFASEEERLL